MACPWINHTYPNGRVDCYDVAGNRIAGVRQARRIDGGIECITLLARKGSDGNIRSGALERAGDSKNVVECWATVMGGYMRYSGSDA